MKSTFARIGGALLVAFVLLGNLPNAAQAQQQGMGITISPPLIEEPVDPGQVLERSIRVRNIDPNERTYTLLVRNISSVNEQGQPTFVDENTPDDYGLSSWVTLGKKTITVKADETVEVPFTITVPKEVSPGGHFGGIFVALGTEKFRGIGSAVGYQVGAILSFRVSGDILEDARIREYRTDKTVYSGPTVKFLTRIENLGNTLIRPRGPIDIVNMFGKKVATLKMNSDASGVFPKQERSFEITWTSEDLAFGRYHGVMSLLYGDEAQRTVSDVVSFWILPLNLIAPVVIGLLVFVLIIFFGLRWYVRRKLEALGLDARAPKDAAAPSTRLPFSYLLFATLAVIVVCLVLLGVLFFLFD